MTSVRGRKPLARGLLVGALCAPLLALATPAAANHPVYVEGNCFGPGAGDAATGLRQSPVAAGTCGDYDGDGLIGKAEDRDGDNNYGTIGAAVTAVANNGRVTIVASGTFPEVVRLQPMNGASISLEAAPGVDANIDAVVQGNPDNAARSAGPGIVIDGCNTCRVTVRNIMTRNFTDGVRVRGRSHVHLDQLHAENNISYGVHVMGRSRVSISNSQVNATGFRADADGPDQPDPGVGVFYEGRSKGSIHRSSVTGSALAGVASDDGAAGTIRLKLVQLFDNGTDFASTQRW